MRKTKNPMSKFFAYRVYDVEGNEILGLYAMCSREAGKLVRSLLGEEFEYHLDWIL